MNFLQEPSSFRDPSGFVFRSEDGTLFRQVNRSYEQNFRKLNEGGLYDKLRSHGLIIEHEDDDLSHAVTDEAYRVIRPRELAFLSFPYEWCFSALKEAALLTLKIQRYALAAEMSLKDASAFNVQFEGTQPVFIDTLSFEQYQAGSPWTAYGQFCRHFLAPLALMAKSDVALNRLLALYLDGVPLTTATKLLPWRTCLQSGLLVHLHLHAKSINRYSDTRGTRPVNGSSSKKLRISLEGLNALVESLQLTISKLSWNPGNSPWGDYYEANSYSSVSFETKKQSVADFLQAVQPKTVWDLGANTGVFSRLAANSGAKVCAFDLDPVCVEMNYLACRQDGLKNVLPLVMDLTNPSPAIGWSNQERPSLVERGPVDVVFALALVHHLAISNNLPLDRVADFLLRLCRHLIIEFVPKEDPQVQRLLRSRPDIFSNYNCEAFEAVFRERATIMDRRPLGDGKRILYLMRAGRE